MRRAALLSVSDRQGIVELAKTLQAAGFELLSTGGTGRHLAEHGIETIAIEQYTGQAEILDGRVKTLHPKIYAGLLAKRSDPKHMRELEASGILPIDVAVINLYPFLEGLSSAAASDPAKMVELIDIGGPAMLRAAAKNFGSVYSVIDPADYSKVAEAVTGPAAEESLLLRRSLAVKVFARLANYNLEISKYFSGLDAPDGFGEIAGCVLQKGQALRYGENPHQKGAYYRPIGQAENAWRQLQGKELSYNNLLDFDAACRIAGALPESVPAVAIIKHLNPCGVACGATLAEALHRAKQSDPRSHFGGIIACNGKVDAALATEVIKDFTEVVVAPAFDQDALAALSSKKNIRLIEIDRSRLPSVEMRAAAGGFLLQEADPGVSQVRALANSGKYQATGADLDDLQLAWSVCAHVKSNAIVLVKDGMLLAAGAGQMSRIDSVELALHKARSHGHTLEGAVAASDAFFPFSDSVEMLAKAGVRAIVVPGGAMRDEEVKAAAAELGIGLFLAEDRHFRH